MRVTYLLSNLGGGTGHHLLDLLDSRGPGDWEAKIVSEVPSTSRMGLPVEHRVLEVPPGPAKYPFRQFLRYRQLEQLFRQEAPDILHTYFFWSIIYGRLLKARGIVPRLVENREDMGFDFGANEYAMLSLTRSLPDRVICVSDAVRNVVLEKEGLHPTRVVTVRNGIASSPPAGDLDLEGLRKELGLETRNPVIMMVANYDRPVKGVRYFVQAIPRIAEAVPEARFILLGQGKSEASVRAEAHRLGVADLLLMPGFRVDVHRFYGLADLSVLTSLSEGLSMTILESMRHGVPLVATDVGGNGEIIRNGRSGVLVPPRQPKKFAEAVIRLLGDRLLRERFQVEGRKTIREDFDLRSVVRSYADTYEQILTGEQEAR